MEGCKKCSTLGGVLILIAGILFLLKDLQVWSFWGVNWWSIVLILFGIGCIGKSGCPDCQKMKK